jgi:hypothetical protein
MESAKKHLYDRSRNVIENKNDEDKMYDKWWVSCPEMYRLRDSGAIVRSSWKGKGPKCRHPAELKVVPSPSGILLRGRRQRATLGVVSANQEGVTVEADGSTHDTECIGEAGRMQSPPPLHYLDDNKGG